MLADTSGSYLTEVGSGEQGVKEDRAGVADATGRKQGQDCRLGCKPIPPVGTWSASATWTPIARYVSAAGQPTVARLAEQQGLQVHQDQLN